MDLVAEEPEKYPRVIVPSCRVAFAQDSTARLNAAIKAAWHKKHGSGVPCPEAYLFRSYLDVPEGTNIAQVNRLVIQMESLPRLRHAAPYDLLILDEMEGDLAQLSSEKTMGSCARSVTAVLYNLMLDAGKVVVVVPH